VIPEGGSVSEEIFTIDANTWEAQVSQSRGFVLVYFWAPRCGHCTRYAPIFEELAKEYVGKMTFAKLNCDENPDVANRCEIRGTPTLVVYRDGQKIDSIVGGIPKVQLQAKLDSLLKE
jgi:thioredoxin 1